MSNWDNMWRDAQEQPLFYPIFKVYSSFMNIKRYDSMPYYFAPTGAKIVDIEDKIINYADWLVDAHEDSRNTGDRNRNFYQRSAYMLNNWMRLQNDTVANMMFDTQLPKPHYDRVNSIIRQQNALYYMSASAFHTVCFMYMAFFFRARRISFLPALGIGAAYYIVFENMNNVLYKLIVDRPVMNMARAQGNGYYVQAHGTKRARDHNFV